MSGDVESGENSLHHINIKINIMNMVHDQNPQLRWSFIRKVYSIITLQLLLTIAVASLVLFVHPIANFFNSKQGHVLYIVLMFVHLIPLWPLFYYHQKHPLNYFLLLFLNVSLALPVGLTGVFTSGRIILEILILTTAMMFGFTLYTFWAGKRDHNFSYLGSFLLGSLSILILLCLIQILFPLGKFSHIYECVISIFFCGYIVLATNYLIKEFTYDQHIMAFISLYQDVIMKLFFPLFVIWYLI